MHRAVGVVGMPCWCAGQGMHRRGDGPALGTAHTTQLPYRTPHLAGPLVCRTPGIRAPPAALTPRYHDERVGLLKHHRLALVHGPHHPDLAHGGARDLRRGCMRTQAGSEQRGAGGQQVRRRQRCVRRRMHRRGRLPARHAGLPTAPAAVVCLPSTTICHLPLTSRGSSAAGITPMTWSGPSLLPTASATAPISPTLPPLQRRNSLSRY